MRYQAVIFDLDGTLLNTIEDIADALNQVLAKNNFPPHGLERYQQMVGLGMEQLVFDALPETARDEATCKRVLIQAGETYATQWKNKTKPYPGIAEMLLALKAKGVKTAVLSNKPQRFTQMCVQALLPAQVFDVILGAQDDIPKKPAPDGALKIARQLGVLPENILYVGDSGTDMQTARAANMFAVGVSWGFRTEQELKEQGADKIIHQAGEILEML
jgi:phosphoglycolate phosphatase